MARECEPAAQEKHHERRREQAATEIVDDLEAVHEAELVRHASALCLRDAGEEPRQQLPVAAHQAVEAMKVGRVVDWIIFVNDDVRRESTPTVHAFEEVVTEQSVLGDSPLEATLELIDVVDPLAHVDAFTEQILIRFGNGARVDVDAGVAGK
jgi:hypothetical protein